MTEPQILAERYPVLKGCLPQIEEAFRILETCFSEDNVLYLAGNGGSCADAEHIVGELMKGFRNSRRPSPSFCDALSAAHPDLGGRLADKLQQGLRAVALDSHPALFTAYLNDVKEGGTYAYAQQLYGYGRRGDVFLGISTSGNSENVLLAAVVARAIGMRTIALTGADGGQLARYADVAIRVPERETYKVQELHLPVYHCLCLMLEERFFG